MSKIAIVSPCELDSMEECFRYLNQESIEDVLDQINKFLDERLERFNQEFRKRFDGYSPELFFDLIHLQKNTQLIPFIHNPNCR